MAYATVGLVGLVGLAFALPAALGSSGDPPETKRTSGISFLAHHDEMTASQPQHLQ